MVTHPVTGLPIGIFSTADQTGCAVLYLLWPYASALKQDHTMLPLTVPRSRISDQTPVEAYAEKHTVGRIRWWSPTQLLTPR